MLNHVSSGTVKAERGILQHLINFLAFLLSFLSGLLRGRRGLHK